jgi:hypothetical protein
MATGAVDQPIQGCAYTVGAQGSEGIAERGRQPWVVGEVPAEYGLVGKECSRFR